MLLQQGLVETIPSLSQTAGSFFLNQNFSKVKVDILQILSFYLDNCCTRQAKQTLLEMIFMYWL